MSKITELGNGLQGEEEELKMRLGRRPFVDLIHFLEKNSIFENLCEHNPEDITPEFKGKIRALYDHADYAIDGAVQGLQGLGELVGASGLQNEECAISASHLSDIGNLITGLADTIERCKLIHVHAQMVLIACSEYKLRHSTPNPEGGVQ